MTWLRTARRAAVALVTIASAAIALPAGHAAAATTACAVGPAEPASRNAAALTTLAWAPFRRNETGWEIYEPLFAHEIGTPCAGDSAGFATALARWQTSQHIAATGVLDSATSARLVAVLQSRRPFVQQSRHSCPPPPDAALLVTVQAADSYGSKTIQLLPDALAAYRAMAAAARAAVPTIAADPRLLTIFSGFRSPEDDAARCEREQNCQGIVRASCSGHRTGTIMDLYLGAAPGFGPDSSDDTNRLFLSRTAAYRWLVNNAGRFGFANYPFEPWHWEWAGPAKP